MAEVPQLEAVAARDKVAEGAVLLDVREDFEWNAGHAPEASHIPLSALPDGLLGLSVSQPVVVVCRSGGRSQQAASFLAEKGYDASNLVGGMHAWSAAGLPMVSESGEAPTVA